MDSCYWPSALLAWIWQLLIAKVEECSVCDGSSAFGPCCALLCSAVLRASLSRMHLDLLVYFESNCILP